MKSFARWYIPALLFWAIALTAAADGDTGTNERIFFMPVSETEEVVVPWLEASGFEVFRATETDTRIRLEAETPGRHWTLFLKAHSPLATIVEVQPRTDHGDQKLTAFWHYLDGYIKLPNSSSATTMRQVVPDEVRNRLNDVVCIYSERDGSPLQLSGFVVDRAGYILSTAHDLTQGQAVSIQFRSGRELDGRIVKLDHDRDLCLIQVNEPVAHAVPLDKGRYRPVRGEALYALDCPHPGMNEIQSGVLDGPPRQVEGRVLWQVRMHVEPGSSGSPIFDDQGRLAGVIKGRYRGTNAVGFVIPFETVLHFLGKN